MTRVLEMVWDTLHSRQASANKLRTLLTPTPFCFSFFASEAAMGPENNCFSSTKEAKNLIGLQFPLLKANGCCFFCGQPDKVASMDQIRSLETDLVWDHLINPGSWLIYMQIMHMTRSSTRWIFHLELDSQWCFIKARLYPPSPLIISFSVSCWEPLVLLLWCDILLLIANLWPQVRDMSI